MIWAAVVVVGALSISCLVTVSLLSPVFFFFSLQALPELTVSGAVAIDVDILEGALSPIEPLAVHGRQSPEELAGGWVGGWGNGLVGFHGGYSEEDVHGKVGLLAPPKYNFFGP
jgi:hypothetical protein